MTLSNYLQYRTLQGSHFEQVLPEKRLSKDSTIRTKIRKHAAQNHEICGENGGEIFMVLWTEIFKITSIFGIC